MKLIEDVRRIKILSTENSKGTIDQTDTKELTEELNEYIRAEKESLEHDIADVGDSSNDAYDYGVVVQITLPSQEEIMKLALEEKKKNILSQLGI